MPTVYTKTIGATGRDYATFTLAEADIATIAGNASLVTADAQVVFNVYNDASFNERVTCDGITTDATRNVVYQAATGEAHDGTLNSGVHVEPTSGSGHVFTVLDEHIVFDGFEVVQRSGAFISDECFRIGNSSNDAEGVTIKNCLIKASSASSCDGIYSGDYNVGSSTYPVSAVNCVIWGAQRAGVHAQMFNASASNTAHYNIVNCTIAGNAYNIGYDVRQAGTVANLKIINCLLFDGGTADYGATAGSQSGSVVTTGSTSNFDERGQVPSAGTPNPVIVTSSRSPGAGDWAILDNITAYANLEIVDDADTDNDILNQGVGPSSNSLVPTYDCRGVARSGTTTDPGAFQLASTDLEGSASINLGGVTTSATGELTHEGAASISLGGVTASAAGELTHEGTASVALEGVTTSATGDLTHEGAASIALGGVTASGAGELTHEGAASVVLDGVTTSATGEIDSGQIEGTASIALGPVTTAATGELTHEGSASIALGGVTASATGELELTGSASIALDGVTVTSTGEFGSDALGTAAIQLDGVSVSAGGELTIEGAASIALSGVTVTSVGALTHEGAGSIALEGVTVSASGAISGPVDGEVSIALDGVSLSASGALTAEGAASILLGDLTLSAAAFRGGSVTIHTNIHVQRAS